MTTTKLKRLSEATVRSYGCGCAQMHYTGPLFEVLHWRMKGNLRLTELQLLEGKRIYFRGHVSLKDEKACLEQLTPADVKWMLETQYGRGMEAGAEKAREEIRKALGVRR